MKDYSLGQCLLLAQGKNWPISAKCRLMTRAAIITTATRCFRHPS
jgi:hypothetical protein